MELVALGLITAVLIAEGYRQTKPLRQARALKALYGQHSREVIAVAEKTLEEQARNLIHRQNYTVSKEPTDPFRISPPDCDGDREVLFRGKWRGDERMKLPGDTEDHCYSLMWRGEGTSYVGQGW